MQAGQNADNSLTQMDPKAFTGSPCRDQSTIYGAKTLQMSRVNPPSKIRLHRIFEFQTEFAPTEKTEECLAPNSKITT